MANSSHASTQDSVTPGLGLLGGIVTGLLCWQTGHAAEYIRQDSPHPGNAEQLDGPIDHAFKPEPIKDRFLWWQAKRTLEGRPAFWRDTRLNIDLRTFDFNRRNSSTDRREALATGFRIEYESGLWNNIGLEAAYYGSYEIDAPPGSGDTGLLAPGQEDIEKLAVANIRYQITDTALAGSSVRLFRQTVNLPFVNKHDIRMLPAVHEGYTMIREGSDVDYIIGHLTRFKDYDS